MKSVVRNSLWNLVGYFLPAAAGLASTPWLIQTLGSERFGVLSLAWTMVMLFSLFDFGVGRSLTRQIAQIQSAGSGDDIRRAISSGLAMSVLLGAIVCLVLLLGAFLLPANPLNVGEEVLAEANWAFGYIFAAGFLGVYGAGLRGALEGFSLFRAVNSVKIVSGVAMFALPAAISLYTDDVSYAVLSVVLTRLFANLAMATQLRQYAPYYWRLANRQAAIAFIKYGGWITVSNIIAPVIVHMDRFLIATLISANAVTFYGVPSDALSRILVFPVSIASRCSQL